jgi:hypothetical protein
MESFSNFEGSKLKKEKEKNFGKLSQKFAKKWKNEQMKFF